MARPSTSRADHDEPFVRTTDTGWTLNELAPLSDTNARSIRSYIAAKLLPGPERRGKATRYRREHLLRLIVIRWLLRERRLGLRTIRADLRTRSAEDLEMLASALANDAQRTALGLSAPATPTRERRDQRVVLAPGLELHLAHDAPPSTRRMAREALRCLGKAGEPHLTLTD